LSGAALALALTALPIVATRHWSQQAVSENPATRNAAIRNLRWLGNEQTLLADSYGNNRWATGGPIGFPLQGIPVSAKDARNIYYRVTGRPFNSVPPPQRAFGSEKWNFIDDFSWDAEQGGQSVGGRLKGLSLAQSRLDGKMDADAGWTYLEWTLEFKNVFTMEREARAQIALPPGGVVSRLTLWVNGEEREAAFAGSGQVRAAYQQVVRVLRRDPVLVTMSGPDRVLMQCYPVPANGGTIKVRLGITAPLHLESAAVGLMRLPGFIERNFSIPEHTGHSVWLESRQPLKPATSSLAIDLSRPGTNSLHGPLRDAELNGPESVIRVARDPSVIVSWSGDRHGTEGQIICQTIESRRAARPDRIILVIDGSKEMKEFMPAFADAIEQLPEGIEFSVVLAKDGAEALSGPVKAAGEASLREAAQRLCDAGTTGGQDNTLALLRGWDLACERTNSVVLWLHGPQPILLENGEALQQRFDWHAWSGASQGPIMLDFQIVMGPNRVLEALNGIAAVQTVPRWGTARADLKRLMGAWSGGTETLGFTRERLATVAGNSREPGGQTSQHLARLWAFDEVQRLLHSRNRDAAVALAATYQLVTPVSGAVVLESNEQFQLAGLTPVDPQSVPSVPEPGTIALLSLAVIAVAAIRGIRRCRRGSGH
jgi:hypothetical protein